jgi:hypothetical protein
MKTCMSGECENKRARLWLIDDSSDTPYVRMTYGCSHHLSSYIKYYKTKKKAQQSLVEMLL